MERAVLRIIDANFNRAREAARVIEEYCRFWLNCEKLSARAKSLRHRLCAEAAKIDNISLICSRDSEADVGRTLTVTGQMERKNLVDVFTAASKRLTEALRALAEMCSIAEPAISKQFEQLRFEAYTLEKDIICFSAARDKFSSVRLYLVLTVTDKISDQQINGLIKSCVVGGADCIQLRSKGVNDNRKLNLAKELSQICRKNNVISIINDRVDIAAIAGADGVHLGQDDLDLKQARSMQLKPMIFGKSTHSLDELKSAIDEGADYVSLGPVFDSPTKPDIHTVGLKYIEQALPILAGSQIGHVAIGGITAENVPQLLDKGVKTIAVSSAVMNAPDPEAACRKLKDLMDCES